MNETITIQIEKTRDYNDTINANGYYLHSKYAPLKEAQRFAKENYHPHHLHVIFGYGMGYIIDELIKICHFNEPILLIDPLIDKGVLKLKKYDYKRLYYVPMNSLEAIENIADKLGSYTTNIVFISSINYDHVIPKSVLTIAELIKDVQHKQMTNINTSGYFAMQWQLNYLLNLEAIRNDASLLHLKKKYNCPVVVAASGPSLTKQLPLLKKYRHKLLLICAGSTVNALLAENIEPDYIISIDGGEGNKKQFEGLKELQAKLIYSPMTHYSVRKQFSQQAFVLVPHVRPGLKAHLNRMFSCDFPIISGGGSVAHFALSIAKYITTGPICLIGQDLAYTNNQSHAEGSKYIKENQQGDLQVRGYNGELVNSSSIFKVMINTFNELQVLDPHENIVLNCTEGGAELVQYEQKTFSGFLEEFCERNIEIKNSLEMVKQSKSFEISEEFKVYNQILSYLEQGKLLAEKEQGFSFSQKTIGKLGKIEKKLNVLYKETCLDMLLEPNIIFAEHQFLPAINETKEQEFKRVRSYIIQLYTSCYASIEQFMAKLKELLAEECLDGSC